MKKYPLHKGPLLVAYQSAHIHTVQHLVDSGCIIDGFDNAMYVRSRKKRSFQLANIKKSTLY